jgi:hypothetical protein
VCVELVLAWAALYNFLRKECRSDDFPIESVEESSSSKLPVNEDHNIKPIIQNQEQEQEDGNAWRTSIAMNMWTNVI